MAGTQAESRSLVTSWNSTVYLWTSHVGEMTLNVLKPTLAEGFATCSQVGGILTDGGGAVPLPAGNGVGGQVGSSGPF